MIMMDENELQRRLAEVEARERAVTAREQAARVRGIRYNMYERITLSPRAIDAIIIGCAVAIVALVIVGAVMGKGL